MLLSLLLILKFLYGCILKIPVCLYPVTFICFLTEKNKNKKKMWISLRYFKAKILKHDFCERKKKLKEVILNHTLWQYLGVHFLERKRKSWSKPWKEIMEKKLWKICTITQVGAFFENEDNLVTSQPVIYLQDAWNPKWALLVWRGYHSCET